ncbi:MAG TPA: GNAT family N-acetyltransferase [Nocardioides sp.]|uniref:GNAT family N-acetyltransferase n=1 Tax=Nocardioides sp. TaxID=35761 RepID=UPI002F41A5F1
MDSVPTLTDGTVTLRAHREDDVQGCFEQCQDPETQRWTTVPVPYSRDDARHFVTEVVRDGWDDGSSWAFALETDGSFGGTVELRDEGHGRAEIAFGAHPRVRGTGTVERACGLLLDWGFGTRGVHTVVWRAYVGNWASRRLAWRLGFSFDGTLRRYLHHRGELVDTWVGTLLAGDDRKPHGRWLDVPVLEADGLRLRPWRDSDVPRIVEACSDERTQQWLGSMPFPYDESEARAYLEHLRENRATGRSVGWAVVDPEDDLALGSVSFFDYMPEVELEIGFWTHPDARGRGVMTRAMARVVAYAFEDLGVRRVMAGAAADNAASRHVIEANGLTAWGTERLGTGIRTGRTDCVFYDVLVEEWRRSRHR